MLGPVIENFGCVAHAWSDVFKEKDDAWELLARILDGQFYDNDEIEEKIRHFFKKRGFEDTYLTLIPE